MENVEISIRHMGQSRGNEVGKTCEIVRIPDAVSGRGGAAMTDGFGYPGVKVSKNGGEKVERGPSGKRACGMIIDRSSCTKTLHFAFAVSTQVAFSALDLAL